MRRSALGALLLLVVVGCSKPAPTPCPPAVETTSSPVVTEPSVSTLTRRPVRSIDAAEGPDGKLWVAAVVEEPGRPTAQTFTWDPATSRVAVDSTRTLRENDMVDLGEPVAVRVAVSKNRAFVVRETASDVVSLFTFDGSDRRAELRGGRDTSVAVSATYVALSLVQHSGRRTVLLYGDRPPIPPSDILAVKPTVPLRADVVDVTPPSPDRAAPHAVVAFVEDRLFVLHRRVLGRLDVTEVGVPSMKPVRSYSRPSKSRGSAKLMSDGAHLFVLDAGVLTELSPDLQVLGERPIDADDVALGPDSQLLSPTGLGSGHFADVVPALGLPAACTPTWIGPKPLLACRLDGDVARVVRVQK